MNQLLHHGHEVHGVLDDVVIVGALEFDHVDGFPEKNSILELRDLLEKVVDTLVVTEFPRCALLRH